MDQSLRILDEEVAKINLKPTEHLPRIVKDIELVTISPTAESKPSTQLSPNKPKINLQKIEKPNIVQEEPQNGFKIKLLTYNVFLRPPFIKNKKSDWKDKRTKELKKLILKYDVVCFQELFDAFSPRKYAVIEAAYEAGFKFFVESPIPGYPDATIIDGGLLTLSKFPILDSEFTKYGYYSTLDRFCQKGVIYTKILVKNSVLHLFNTHVQASYSFGMTKKSVPSYLTRFYQIIELRKIVRATLLERGYKEKDLVLICGDLNIDSNGSKVMFDYYLKSFKELMPHLEKSELARKEEVSEYDLLLYALKNDGENEIVDLLKESASQNSSIKKLVTYADFDICEETGKKLPKETKFTWNSDYGMGLCLDYIISFCPKFKKKKFKNPVDLDPFSKLRIVSKSCKIQHNFIEGEKYSQLSDHYAVELELESLDLKVDSFEYI